MTIAREGRALSDQTLEPGATSYDKPGIFKGWGEGKGITSDCGEIRDELLKMVSELLDVFVAEGNGVKQ